jgi:hypothetical protein
VCKIFGEICHAMKVFLLSQQRGKKLTFIEMPADAIVFGEASTRATIDRQRPDCGWGAGSASLRFPEG